MAEIVNKEPSLIEKKWYVVRAISGQEKKVKQYIEVEINRLKIYGCYSFFLDGDDISLFKCVTYPLTIMVVEGVES